MMSNEQHVLFTSKCCTCISHCSFMLPWLHYVLHSVWRSGHPSVPCALV